jgi:hypothetical protein
MAAFVRSFSSARAEGDDTVVSATVEARVSAGEVFDSARARSTLIAVGVDDDGATAATDVASLGAVDGGDEAGVGVTAGRSRARAEGETAVGISDLRIVTAATLDAAGSSSYSGTLSAALSDGDADEAAGDAGDLVPVTDGGDIL